MTANDYALAMLFYALAGMTVGIGGRARALQSEGKELPLRGFEFLGALGGFGYGVAGTTLLVGVGSFAAVVLLVAAGLGGTFGRSVYERPDKTMVVVGAAVIVAVPILFHFVLG